MNTKQEMKDSEIVDKFCELTDGDISSELVTEHVTDGVSYMSENLVMALFPSENNYIMEEILFKYNFNPEELVYEKFKDNDVVRFVYSGYRVPFNQKYLSVIEELTGYTIDDLMPNCWLTQKSNVRGKTSLLIVDLPDSNWSIALAPMLI